MENGSTYKNVKLVKGCRAGYEVWYLYHIEPDGKEWEDPYFSYFMEHLLPGEGSNADAKNTRILYGRRVAHFDDFLIEAVKYMIEQGEDDISGTILSRLIKKYSKFLAEANESGDELVAEVAKRLNATPCAPSTQAVYIAAVNKYLDLSENFNTIMRDLNIRDVNGTPLYSEVDLFPEASGRVNLPTSERNALTKNSMLAGVMSGGAKLKRLAKLKPLKSSGKAAARKKSEQAQGLDLEDFYQQDHFPFEHTGKLITEGFKLLRNKALFCLIMACGCRIHEALLLTWQDIDAERQIVRLRDPHTKNLKDFGGYFSNRSQVQSLPWKARATERTTLIEPFRTHFWRLLAEYQKSTEFTFTNSHNFVFQITKGKNKGAPLFTCDYKDISEAMVAACKRIGIAPRKPHSLRHMFGVFCLNFIPFDDGTYGMGLLALKDLMGHASSTSTERYAIPDTKLMMMRQKFIFATINDFCVNTGAEVRLEVARAEFERLQAEIAYEKQLLELEEKKTYAC